MAECSSSGNAMRQFTKHFNQDTSLQRDFFKNAATTAGPSMRTVRPALGTDDQQLLDEFFEQQQKQQPGGQSAFRFNDMHQELSAIHQSPGFDITPGADWSQEFHGQQGGTHLFEMNPEEEAAFSAAFQQYQPSPHEWQEEFMQKEHTVEAMPAEFEAAFQKNFDWANEFALVEGKGKGKALDTSDMSWEAQYEAIQRNGDTVTSITGPIDFDEHEQLEDLWNTLKDNLTDTDDIQNILDDPKSWETEFADFNALLAPQLGPYIFEPNNHYLTHYDPMAEGIRVIEQGGSLSEAALAFEAAVQKEENNSQAWTMLGNVQAQNEKEEPAIRALGMAVKADPNNLDAYMNLAVSYTNEGYEQQAYETLERWLATKYPDIVAANGPPPSSISPWETHDRVTDLYLQAVRNAPTGAEIDADLQVGLGVLFYGSGDYEKAVDCFVAALKARPNDYLLWNRLGATLANSGKSEDAIEAYHKALEIKPSFVRARYNLGVSCINIGCHKEAAEHLLGALSMHQSDANGGGGGVNVSGNLWETLRRTFNMMGRSDLAERAAAGTDINQFRHEFEF